ncbi:MAG: CPBP family intramembrane glutamic endopeptidase [Parasphingorhabdus sp.]|uniref:CPBP family intramembrane glutamic endopeptidase n=1 Tax=Parasphingorhabdus sp. TaxID=2709688 RepID=UPI003298D598
MKIISNTFQPQRYPLLLPILLVVGSISLFKLAGLYPLSSRFAEDMVHSSLQILLCIAVIALLKRFELFDATGLTNTIRNWPRNWPFAVVPMGLIGLINLLSVDWNALTFDGVRVTGWIYNSVSTGLFEEILLRGFCFYFLYRCWQERENAIFLAAFAQALIFGVAHLSNLQNAPVGDVLPQVIYATLLGIGFAGIAVYTKSIWPTIAIHSFINAMGDLDNFFGPEIPDSAGDVSGYLAAIIIIFCVATVPGLYLLRLGQKRIISAREPG